MNVRSITQPRRGGQVKKDTIGSLTLPIIHPARTHYRRSDMPQIEDTAAFLAYLEQYGIHHRAEVLRADDLRPVQNEVNLQKVFKIIEAGLDTVKYPIITSEDLHVLDGNHRYWAARTLDVKVHIIRVESRIDRLVAVANRWAGVRHAAILRAGAAPSQG